MALFSARNLLTLTLPAFAKNKNKKKTEGEISVNRTTLFLPLEDTCCFLGHYSSCGINLNFLSPRLITQCRHSSQHN